MLLCVLKQGRIRARRKLHGEFLHHKAEAWSQSDQKPKQKGAKRHLRGVNLMKLIVKCHRFHLIEEEAIRLLGLTLLGSLVSQFSFCFKSWIGSFKSDLAIKLFMISSVFRSRLTLVCILFSFNRLIISSLSES